MAITQWQAAERPRERLVARGADGLSDGELLAVVLRTGYRGDDAVALARGLLARFGSLNAVLSADLDRLRAVPGIGTAKAAALKAVVALAARYLEAGVRERAVLTGSLAVRRFLQSRIGGGRREVFAVLFLDSQHRLIEYRELFHGTLDAAVVHPREVVRAVIEMDAAAIILAHNHPSGIAEPSAADLALTERLRNALALIDVRVLDHVIVVRNDALSMAERGLL